MEPRVDLQELQKRVASFLKFRFKGARGIGLDDPILIDTVVPRHVEREELRIEHGGDRRALAAPQIRLTRHPERFHDLNRIRSFCFVEEFGYKTHGFWNT